MLNSHSESEFPTGSRIVENYFYFCYSQGRFVAFARRFARRTQRENHSSFHCICNELCTKYILLSRHSGDCKKWLQWYIREATKYNNFFLLLPLSSYVYASTNYSIIYTFNIFQMADINVQMLHGKNDFTEILKNSNKYRFENNFIELWK